MVMIKMLTHRGVCHAGRAAPALCSLGRYFASLLFNPSAILILQLQTVVCGFAQLPPGFPSAGSGGRGLSSRLQDRESPCAFCSQRSSSAHSWERGRGVTTPPAGADRPVLYTLGSATCSTTGQVADSALLLCVPGEDSKVLCQGLKHSLLPDHSGAGCSCSARCRDGLYATVAPFAPGTGATHSPIPSNLTLAPLLPVSFTAAVFNAGKPEHPGVSQGAARRKRKRKTRMTRRASQPCHGASTEQVLCLCATGQCLAELKGCLALLTPHGTALGLSTHTAQQAGSLSRVTQTPAGTTEPGKRRPRISLNTISLLLCTARNDAGSNY